VFSQKLAWRAKASGGRSSAISCLFLSHQGSCRSCIFVIPSSSATRSTRVADEESSSRFQMSDDRDFVFPRQIGRTLATPLIAFLNHVLQYFIDRVLEPLIDGFVLPAPMAS